MAFERSPGMACLCLFALLAVVAAPSQAATVTVHLASDGLPLTSGAPAVIVNGSPARYAGDGTYVADVGDGSAVGIEASYDGHSAMADALLHDGQADVRLDIPREYAGYVVRGTVYAVSSGGQRPWPGGHINVEVGDTPATVEGSNYSAVLYAPGDGSPVKVTVMDDSGYVLGSAAGAVALPGGATNIDVMAPALEVSGDVYARGLPADGASLFVYLNDRPYGPITATSGQGPMFTLSIPGGHPGDHVSISASNGDGSGVVSQDASGYRLFLTINLKGTSTCLPYAGILAPRGTPAPQQKENGILRAVDIGRKMLVHHIL